MLQQLGPNSPNKRNRPHSRCLSTSADMYSVHSDRGRNKWLDKIWHKHYHSNKSNVWMHVNDESMKEQDFHM